MARMAPLRSEEEYRFGAVIECLENILLKVIRKKTSLRMKIARMVLTVNWGWSGMVFVARINMTTRK